MRIPLSPARWSCSAAAMLVLPAFLFAICQPCRADGLVYQLPPDGAWADYELQLTVTIEGKTTRQEALLRLSSVGKAKHESIDCRWIELHVHRAKPDLADEVIKVLIPEKHLAAGADPLAHLVRGWHKRGAGEPMELDRKRPRLRIGPLALFLTGPLQSVKKQAPQTFTAEGVGSLATEVETGRGLLPLAEGSPAAADYTIWRHAHAPFGAVKMQIELKLEQGGKKAHSLFEASLLRRGMDAPSRLPEAR